MERDHARQLEALRSEVAAQRAEETYASQKQLNIIIFDATRRGWIFAQAVNQLKRVIGDCSLDDRFFWERKSPRMRTVLYYQGDRARPAAEWIADRLPGNQDVAPIGRTNYFGIHEDRDIVMMLGQDAEYIARNLAEDENTYPCPGLGTR